MAIVKMHQASDGSLFKTYEEYAQHEGYLRIRKVLEGAEFDTNAFAKDDYGNDVLYPENITTFIVDNADLLRTALAAGVVTQRGRKAAQ